PLDAALSLSAVWPLASDSYSAQTIKQYHEVLKDLFIVSEVAILSESEAAVLMERAAGRKDFSSDGTFVHQGTDTSIVLQGRHAAGAKCARCWKYFDDGVDSELDARCRA